MKIIKQVLWAMAVASVLSAQAPEETVRAQEKRMFQVKYANPNDLANVLSVFGYHLEANRDLQVLTVSAPHDVIAAMEDAIKRFDVPSKDIGVTVYLVVASQQPDGTSTVPTELQAVTNELKNVLSFRSFRVLDTILLRTQLGKMASVMGIIGGNEAAKTTYNFSAQPVSMTEDAKGRLIRFARLGLTLQVPGPLNASISTEITVREGQKVVVGKSNMGGTDQALIMVMTAKVTD